MDLIIDQMIMFNVFKYHSLSDNIEEVPGVAAMVDIHLFPCPFLVKNMT